MKKFLKVLFLGVVVCSFILSGLPGAFAQLAPEIPRSETVIADVSTRAVAPDNFNVWAATWRNPDRGIQQLMLEPLWMDDPATGKIINALASDKPIYNKDFTKMTIKLRKGIYWSDGVEFTADDVVYTVQLIMKHSDLSYYAQFSTYVDKVYKVGNYTVVFELKKPNTRFHTYFVDRWGACRPLPKHVFEKAKDPVTFAFNPPISSGPYVMKSYDPGGYWTLWERRADWDKTPTGKLYGMPQPKYVLYICMGTSEKDVLAINSHQMDMAERITMEGLRSVLATNKYARSYRKDFPWVINVDPCMTGITLNTAKAPFNNKDVRWALTLSIDIVDYLSLAFDGVGTVGVLAIPPTPVYLKWYYGPMESWIKNFTIDVDGKPFKVYDPNVPMRLAEYAKSRGYKVPTEPKEIRETFGYGWFKYAPDVAEKLLIKNGFKRDKDGKWLLPDGKPWKITILTSTNPAHPAFRNAFAASQEWKKFGIDVEVVSSEMQGTLQQRGEFDASSTWPATEPWGGHPDLYRTFNPWRSIFVKPIGEQTFGHVSRWSDPRMDKVIEEMEKIGWDDPKTRQLGIEGLKIVFEEMPSIPTTLIPSIISWDEYYWTNYPGVENPYCFPMNCWPNLKYMLPFLKPTGRK